MVQITVEEARQRLPGLLDAVEAGEEVEIRAENGRSYKLAPTRPRTRPPACRKPAG
jgi:antitoxin (DNA-binding transcriptional repressor) of toxin-antitoxin stability system